MASAIVLPIASAAPYVILYNVRMSAEPSIAGKNMPVTLTASVEFGGACCYAVFAHDVKAQLNLSKGLRLISGEWNQPVTSPDQTTSGRVTAQPGGGLTKIKLMWVVISDQYGEYLATLHVTGYSIRAPLPDEFINQTETIKLPIVPGAAVSAPFYPHPPMVGSETPVIVNVTATTGWVTEVKLNYSFDNSTWFSTPMNKTTMENNNWLGIIPSRDKETKIFMHIFSMNSLNQTFTTPLYIVEIKDYGAINTVRTMANALIITGTIAGIIFVVSLYMYNDKLNRKRHKRGLLCIGSSSPICVTDASSEINSFQLLLARRRKYMLMVLVILFIVLLIAAIYSGQFSTIVSRTTNPSGS